MTYRIVQAGAGEPEWVPEHECAEDELREEIKALDKRLQALTDEREDLQQEIDEAQNDAREMRRELDADVASCAVDYCEAPALTLPEQVYLTEYDVISVRLCFGHQPHMRLRHAS